MPCCQFGMECIYLNGRVSLEWTWDQRHFVDQHILIYTGGIFVFKCVYTIVSHSCLCTKIQKLNHELVFLVQSFRCLIQEKLLSIPFLWVKSFVITQELTDKVIDYLYPHYVHICVCCVPASIGSRAVLNPHSETCHHVYQGAPK